MASDRKAIVASFATGDQFSPRVSRTRMVSKVLERSGFVVERMPPARDGGRGAGPREAAQATLPRRIARRVAKPVAIDYFEPGTLLLLRNWSPSGSGALLIGWPFSPLYHAARRLVAAQIPYVVDVGDPWALTGNAPASTRTIAGRRARSAESFLWSNAAGGIVTTESQAAALHALFPGLSLLSRPNGYVEADVDHPRPPRASPRGSTELRLVQFGALYSIRLPVGDWFARLRREAGVDRVHVVNYGHVIDESLLGQAPGVTIELRPPIQWSEALRVATDFDAALVVGNRDPVQLPSKAVQYQTLPIPRIALTTGQPGDELASFADTRTGFVAVGIDSRSDLTRAVDRLRRSWSADELEPPPSDSWPEVGREIVEFVLRCWDSR